MSDVPDHLAERFPAIEGWSCAVFRGDFIFVNPNERPHVARQEDGQWVVSALDFTTQTTPLMVNAKPLNRW